VSVKSTAFRVLLAAHKRGAFELDEATAAALLIHAELLTDLHLLGNGSEIRPGGRIDLSVLGHGLLSQLSDVAVLREQ
jgi:hypothetical protein